MPCLISSGTSYYAVSKGKLRCWFWHSWPQDYGLKFLIEFCYRLWGWLTDVTTRFTFRWGCIMFWAILNFSNVPMMLIFNLTVKMNEKCKIYFPCYVGCTYSTCFCCTLYYGYCFWSFLYIFYERMIWRIFFLPLQEFYHGQVRSNNSNLPRIFGMTASPIKTKGVNDLMHSSSCFFCLHYAEWPTILDLLPITFLTSRDNINMVLC